MPGNHQRKRGKLAKAASLVVASCVLLVALAVVWLNIIGLPEWITRKAMRGLERSGYQVSIHKAKLSGLSKLMLSEVTVAESHPGGSTFSAQRLDLWLRPLRLKDGLSAIAKATVIDGRYSSPLSSETTDHLMAEKLNGTAIYSSGDVVITNSTGLLLGIHVNLEGKLLNVQERFRTVPPPRESAAIAWKEPVAEVQKAMRRIISSKAPELGVIFFADALHPEKLMVKLALEAEQTDSPWGNVGKLTANFVVTPDEEKSASKLAGQLRFESLKSSWADLKRAEHSFEVSLPRGANAQFSAEGKLLLYQMETPWGELPEVALQFDSQESGNGKFNTAIAAKIPGFASSNVLAGSTTALLHFEHANPLRLGIGFGDLASGEKVVGTWSLEGAGLSAGQFKGSDFFGKGSIAQHAPVGAGADWGPWKLLDGWTSQFEFRFSNLVSTEVPLGNLHLRGGWTPPFLKIEEAESDLYDGVWRLEALLNVESRKVESALEIQFDLHRVSPMLQLKVQKHLQEVSWNSPPEFTARATFAVPPWTNSWSSFADEIVASLALQGRFKMSGAYRGVPLDYVQTDFSFSDGQFHLPNLEINQPAGHASISIVTDQKSQEFRIYLNSHLDPFPLQTLVPEDVQEAFRALRFSSPPEIEGELRGILGKADSVRFEGKVRAQNFQVKGEPFLDLQAEVSYADELMQATDLVVHRVPGEEARAPWLEIDIPEKVMRVKDVVSTMNPYIAMQLVGPVPYKAIEPYQFATPPLVKVSGVVPLSDPPNAADLRFEVSGEDFTYWRFKSKSLSGLIHWKGDDLVITNVFGEFYGGEVRWNGYFHFNDNDTADFRFEADVRETNAKLLLQDIVTSSNRIEGVLHGRLVITQANSEDFNTWVGYGNASLRNGFLWDIPVFGTFTPLLETISPGLGISRITSGSASFRITNSVVSTKDLEVRASAFRLKYEGDVDFDGNLKATMEALLLRDTWLVGKALSFTLLPLSKAFEAEISGTLDQPKSKLRHFPGIIAAPLKSVDTFKGLWRRATGKPAKNPQSTPKE